MSTNASTARHKPSFFGAADVNPHRSPIRSHGLGPRIIILLRCYQFIVTYFFWCLHVHRVFEMIQFQEACIALATCRLGTLQHAIHVLLCTADSQATVSCQKTTNPPTRSTRPVKHFDRQPHSKDGWLINPADSHRGVAKSYIA